MSSADFVKLCERWNSDQKCARYCKQMEILFIIFPPLKVCFLFIIISRWFWFCFSHCHLNVNPLVFRKIWTEVSPVKKKMLSEKQLHWTSEVDTERSTVQWFRSWQLYCWPPLVEAMSKRQEWNVMFLTVFIWAWIKWAFASLVAVDFRQTTAWGTKQV